MTKPILVKNTKEMMTNLDFPKCIKLADLGCSSGQNTFTAMSDIVNTIIALCEESNKNPPEIDCCLNDLSGNDFNMTFKFLTFFNDKLTSKIPCFVSGVPGSFYSRLFPRKSLHFVHSNYSLHYLSKVPDRLEKNKMSVYITGSSLPSEHKAYLNQFQKDFTAFLRMRSEEMVSNGRMVLTLIGRKTLDDPLYRDCCHWLTLLSDSLRDFGDAINIATLFEKYAHHVSQHSSSHKSSNVVKVLTLPLSKSRSLSSNCNSITKLFPS